MKLTRTLLTGIAAALVGGVSAPLAAQRPPSPGSAADALLRFRTETLAGRPGSRGGVNALARILGSRRVYPVATVDSVLDGLEGMAVGSPDMLASAAAAWLSDAGRTLGERGGLAFPRLVRVYDGSASPVVRLLVVQGMARQPASAPVTVFLERVATSDPGAGHSPDEPWSAVSTLSQLGDRGKTALRRIHRNQTVRDRKAHAFLDYLAGRQFNNAPGHAP